MTASPASFQVWNLATGRVLGTFAGERILAISPDGRLVATPGKSDNTIQIVDIATSKRALARCEATTKRSSRPCRAPPVTCSWPGLAVGLRDCGKPPSVTGSAGR